jgi:drug/metabolite transporter (DMT)-like permease
MSSVRPRVAPSPAMGVAAMLGATLLWGGTFVVIRDSLHTLDAGALVFGRFVVATVVLGAIVARRRVAPPRAVLVNGAISGVMVAACYLLQAIGLRSVSAGSSAFLTCAGSLFAGLFAWLVIGQRPGTALWIGLALAMVGSALLSLDSALRLGFGEVVTLLGALSYALGIAWVARLGGAVDPLLLAAVQSLVSVVVLAFYAPVAVEQLGRLGAPGWARFAYLALAGSVIAPVLMLYALRALPTGRIGLLLALEPVFALVFAATVGGEHFGPRWWAGAALILVAVATVEGRAAAERPAPP